MNRQEKLQTVDSDYEEKQPPNPYVTGNSVAPGI